MSTGDDRDNAMLRHFGTRAQQPRVLTRGQMADLPPSSMTPMSIHIEFDQAPARAETTADRWTYVGSDAQLSRAEQMRSRRTNMNIQRGSQ